MNKMIKIKKISLILLFSIFYFLFSPSVFASEMFFVSDVLNPKLDEIFQVNVYLDTQNKEINALEGKIIFPKDKIDLREIKTVNSVVNLWFDHPHLNIHSDYREVMFGGVIPGGYNEDKGLILSLTFRAIDNGSISFSFKDLKISLNDGLGTEGEISFKSQLLTISSSGLNVVAAESVMADKIPPESFSPSIGRDANIFENRWFAVFVAEDKQSGINHYEIVEKRTDKQENNYQDLSWETAVSPYVLRDQKLKSFIYIKAVDNIGNSRIIPIPPTNAWFWYEKPSFWIIMGVLVVIMIIFGNILWKKILKKKKII